MTEEEAEMEKELEKLAREALAAGDMDFAIEIAAVFKGDVFDSAYLNEFVRILSVSNVPPAGGGRILKLVE